MDWQKHLRSIPVNSAKISDWQNFAARRQAEIERLRTALEWYADIKNYDGTDIIYAGGDATIPIDDDAGKIARRALAESEGDIERLRGENESQRFALEAIRDYDGIDENDERKYVMRAYEHLKDIARAALESEDDDATA